MNEMLRFELTIGENYRSSARFIEDSWNVQGSVVHTAGADSVLCEKSSTRNRKL